MPPKCIGFHPTSVCAFLRCCEQSSSSNLSSSSSHISALAANVPQEVDSESSVLQRFPRKTRLLKTRISKYHQIFRKKKSCQRFLSQIGKILNISLRCEASDFSFGRTCVCSHRSSKLIERWESCQKVFPQSFGKPNIHLKQ